mgnify:FL=1
MNESKLRKFISEQIAQLLTEKFGSRMLSTLVNGMAKWEKSKFLQAGVKTGLDWNTLSDSDVTIVKKTPKQLYGKQGIYVIIASQDFDFSESGAYGWNRSIKKGQMIGMMIGGKVAYVTQNGLGGKSRHSDKVGLDVKGARSVAAMAEMPHIVFQIDYSDKKDALKDKQGSRAAMKFGATAFKTAKQFKDENIRRYTKALEAAADKKENVVKLVLQAVNESNKVIKKALSEMRTDNYGNVGVEVGGKVIELTYVTRKQNEILDAFSRYTNFDKQAGLNKSDYYAKERASYALTIKKKVAQMMAGKYDSW